MTSPITLTGEALAFWNRHATRLEERRILTESDLDSFALLCLTWSMLVVLQATEPGEESYREMIQFVNLNKQYQALAKQFGLLPRERKAAKGMDDDPATKKDEFGL